MKRLFVSQSNRRGVLILIGVLLLIAFLPRLVMVFSSQTTSTISMEDRAILSEIANDKEQYKDAKQRKKNKFRSPPSKFNPNNYTSKDWQYLGLSEKQAAIVMKFGKRGIRNYEQLSKIFVIHPTLLALIKDSLVFDEVKRESSYQEQSAQKWKKEVKVIDLNRATKEELESLPMIGEKLADRIIKYRDRLGGFYAKEQLLDVYGLEASNFNAIEQLVSANQNGITPIHLNTASAEELKKHPYFNWNIANSVVKLRSQKGSFKSIQDIMESKIVDLEFFEKIKPYLAL